MVNRRDRYIDHQARQFGSWSNISKALSGAFETALRYQKPWAQTKAIFGPSPYGSSRKAQINADFNKNVQKALDEGARHIRKSMKDAAAALSDASLRAAVLKVKNQMDVASAAAKTFADKQKALAVGQQRFATLIGRATGADRGILTGHVQASQADLGSMKTHIRQEKANRIGLQLNRTLLNMMRASGNIFRVLVPLKRTLDITNQAFQNVQDRFNSFARMQIDIARERGAYGRQMRGSGINFSNMMSALGSARRSGMSDAEAISQAVDLQKQLALARWGEGGLDKQLGRWGISIYQGGRPKSDHQIRLEESRRLARMRDPQEKLQAITHWGYKPEQLEYIEKYAENDRKFQRRKTLGALGTLDDARILDESGMYARIDAATQMEKKRRLIKDQNAMEEGVGAFLKRRWAAENILFSDVSARQRGVNAARANATKEKLDKKGAAALSKADWKNLGYLYQDLRRDLGESNFRKTDEYKELQQLKRKYGANIGETKDPMERIYESLDRVTDHIGNWVEKALNFFADKGPSLVDKLVAGMDYGVDAAKKLWDATRGARETVGDWLKVLKDDPKQAMRELGSGIRDELLAVVDFFSTVVIPPTQSAISGIWTWTVESLKDKWEDFSNYFSSVVMPPVKGLMEDTWTWAKVKMAKSFDWLVNHIESSIKGLALAPIKAGVHKYYEMIGRGGEEKGGEQGSAGNFASGGIVPGNSYTGDKLTANVNSGELILNKAQQDRLARELMEAEINAELKRRYKGPGKLFKNQNANRLFNFLGGFVGGTAGLLGAGAKAVGLKKFGGFLSGIDDAIYSQVKSNAENDAIANQAYHLGEAALILTGMGALSKIGKIVKAGAVAKETGAVKRILGLAAKNGARIGTNANQLRIGYSATGAAAETATKQAGWFRRGLGKIGSWFKRSGAVEPPPKVGIDVFAAGGTAKKTGFGKLMTASILGSTLPTVASKGIELATGAYAAKRLQAAGNKYVEEKEKEYGGAIPDLSQSLANRKSQYNRLKSEYEDKKAIANEIDDSGMSHRKTPSEYAQDALSDARKRLARWNEIRHINGITDPREQAGSNAVKDLIEALDKNTEATENNTGDDKNKAKEAKREQDRRNAIADAIALSAGTQLHDNPVFRSGGSRFNMSANAAYADEGIEPKASVSFAGPTRVRGGGARILGDKQIRLEGQGPADMLRGAGGFDVHPLVKQKTIFGEFGPEAKKKEPLTLSQRDREEELGYAAEMGGVLYDSNTGGVLSEDDYISIRKKRKESAGIKTDAKWEAEQRAIWKKNAPRLQALQERRREREKQADAERQETLQAVDTGATTVEAAEAAAASGNAAAAGGGTVNSSQNNNVSITVNQNNNSNVPIDAESARKGIDQAMQGGWAQTFASGLVVNTPSLSKF